MTASFLKADSATWAKRCSYIGVFILILTLNFSLYWGNLSVYTGSYFRHHLGPSSDTSSPWVLSSYNTGWGVSSLLSGFLAHLVGTSWTLVLGCVFLDSSLFLSAVSVQHSMICLYLSLGLLNGLGTGLVLNVGLQHAMSFRPKYVGSVMAVILSARNMNGAFANQLVTWYINPANVRPDLVHGRQKYFTQSEVLDRVPSMFLVLGTLSLCCHVLGIPLIRSKVEEEVEEAKEIPVHKKQQGDTQGDSQEAGTSMKTKNPPAKEDTSLPTDFTPRQVLKTKTFYVMTSLACNAEYSFVIIANFFKDYGQTWISDDQFLANTATAFLISSVIARPFWGILIDQVGVKSSLLGLSCALSLVSSFFYFTPMLSRWVYFGCTMMFGTFANGFYFLIPITTMKLFGNKNFSMNYGLVMSSTIVFNLLIPVIVREIFTGCGWFYVFSSVGCINVVALIFIVFCVPRH